MKGWHFQVKGIMKFIQEFAGINDWQTIREWEENEHFPIRRTPKNRPFIIESEVMDWFITYDNLRKEKLQQREN